MSVQKVGVTRVDAESRDDGDDVVAVEEPLEIRAAWTSEGETRERTVAVTMRTPGDDFDLAAGFFFTEGLIRSAEDIESVRHWGSPNHVRVAVTRIDLSKADRNFAMTASCGVCGKTSIDSVRIATTPLAGSEPADAALIRDLPRVLHEAQPAFRATGSMHGAAIIDRAGNVLAVREDIGRHNAVDKAIGVFVRADPTPLASAILFVTSRAGFEIVQKAIVAGIPTVASIGGPSSLAIELARECNLTLAGFVRGERFNVYSGRVG